MAAKIHKVGVEDVPEAVVRYFNMKYPIPQFRHNFYWYPRESAFILQERVWACEVMEVLTKGDRLFDNSCQGTENEFKRYAKNFELIYDFVGSVMDEVMEQAQIRSTDYNASIELEKSNLIQAKMARKLEGYFRHGDFNNEYAKNSSN